MPSTKYITNSSNLSNVVMDVQNCTLLFLFLRLSLCTGFLKMNYYSQHTVKIVHNLVLGSFCFAYMCLMGIRRPASDDFSAFGRGADIVRTPCLDKAELTDSGSTPFGRVKL